ncbi:MAG: alpha/beta hydrolase [Deltaproteobacteria bacterium]|jgi:pimeloyl-ACP methyl ester carboxylesterase|nr:alpha/beta hydrolase [Deltaproteobacteria bacterium]
MKKDYRVVNGKKFFLLAWGEPKDKAIVGIHGLSANCCHMAAVSEFLASRGHYVLAYDVRGRGESSPADVPSSMMSHALDAKELLEALPLSKVALMGYSMGGYIAGIAAGLSDKVAGVVLFDGGGLCTREDAEKLIPALSRMDKVFSTPEEYVEAAKANYALMGLSWNRFIEAAVLHEVAPSEGGKYRYKGNAERIKEDLLDVAEYKHSEIYAKVNCPVLLVHAEGSLGQGPALYKEEAYDITRKSLRNVVFYQTKANHYTMMLEPQPELNEKVCSFIETCGI